MRLFANGRARFCGVVGCIAFGIALMATFSSSARAPAPLSEPKAPAAWTPKPGRYVTEPGWGHLDILPFRTGLRFSLETIIGESGCSLEGDVLGDRGVARSEWGDGICVVHFKPGRADAIGVAPVDMAQCRKFCGYNGGIEGDYLAVAETCTEPGLDAARQHFKHLYDARQYKAALSTLSKVFDLCRPTLTWQQEGEIRNDLALAQHHNGLDRECLQTLAPYAEDAAKDDEEAAQSWPPGMSDRYLSIVRAARENLQLCRQD